MLSWDEKITNDEETEHLLEAIFAAAELNEAELETVTSAPSLYQRLQWRIGIGTPEEPQTELTHFQHTWPSSSTLMIERETPDDVFPVRQQFYGLNEKAVTTQPRWRLPHIRSNV